MLAVLLTLANAERSAENRQTFCFSSTPPTPLMPEPWLRWNTRPYLLIAVQYAVMVIAFLVALLLTGWSWASVPLLGVVLLQLVLFGGAWVWLRRHPLLGYESGYLLCNLKGMRPIRLPIDVAEGFLLGEGPSYLPGKAPARLDTRTLVLRIAERATDWEHIETNDRLASWCGGYVTIRGTWSEPLTLELVHKLNQRLYDVTHPPSAVGAAS